MSGISQECLGEYPFITCCPRDEAVGFFIELVSGKHGRAVCSTPHHTGSLVTELMSLPFWTDIPAAVASLTYSSCGVAPLGRHRATESSTSPAGNPIAALLPTLVATEHPRGLSGAIFVFSVDLGPRSAPRAS